MKIRADDFRKWFTDPEAELQAFLDSDQAIMNILFSDRERAVELSKREAAQLLEKIRAEKDNKNGKR